jgi:hypothetical protein
LRQFKALGIQQSDLNSVAGAAGASADLADDDGPHSRLPESCSIQQRNCEAETLRVFRLITGQVFGRLLEESQAEENAAFDDLHYPAAAANAAAVSNWDQVLKRGFQTMNISDLNLNDNIITILMVVI